jgi:outer membrane protein assembly factor BamB
VTDKLKRLLVGLIFLAGAGCLSCSEGDETQSDPSDVSLDTAELRKDSETKEPPVNTDISLSVQLKSYHPPATAVLAVEDAEQLGDRIRFEWTFDNGETETTRQGSIEQVYRAPGEYEPTVEVVESGKTLTRAEATLTLEPNDAAFEVFPSDPVVGQTVTFDASASKIGDAVDFVRSKWTINNSAQVTKGASVEHTFDEPGDQTIELGLAIVNNADAEPQPESLEIIDSAQKNIEIRPRPEISVEPSSPRVVERRPLTFDLTISASDNLRDRVETYQWNFGDGTTLEKESDEAVEHTFHEAGTFEVKVTLTKTNNTELEASSEIPVTEADWPSFQNGPKNRGESPLSAQIDEPVKRWTFDAEDAVRTAPVVDDIDGDNRPEVIFGSDDGNIYALEAKTGDKEWSFETESQVRTSPIVSNIDEETDRKTIFAGAENGTVYALRGDNGETSWRFETKGAINHSLQVYDVDKNDVDEVIFGSADEYLYAVNAENGDRAWRSKMSSPIRSGTAIGDVDADDWPEIIVAEQAVRAIEVRDGFPTVEWTFSSDDAHSESRATPTIADIDGDSSLEVLSGSENGKLYILSGEDGTEDWTYKIGDAIRASVAVGDINLNTSTDIAIPSHDEKLYVVDGRRQETIWSLRAFDWFGASPVLSELYKQEPTIGGIPWPALDVAVGNRDGFFYTLNAGGSPQRKPRYNDNLRDTGWRLDNEGPIRRAAAIADIDGDGSAEIIVGSDKGTVSAIE